MKSSVAFVLFLTAAALSGQPCAPAATRLCLSGGRFSTEVSWKDFQGQTGVGQAVTLTPDTGYFWFFSASNVELIVKVLDARALNGHFWVFYGALSNVEYELTVRDTQTGDLQIYGNTAGQFGSAGDTLAFPPDSDSLAFAPLRALAAAGTPIDESAILEAPWESRAACSPGATALCLAGGRFRVEAAWKDFQGNTGAGQAVSLTSDTGYFWFFSSTNVEVVLKVLDARALNDSFWVFYGALSNVEYTLTVTDTVTGIVKTYSNASGLFASAGDTLAFGKPTTFQLIDGAVVKGEIDADTALLYKVYAFFGDARLPQAYAGEPPVLEEHGILFEVADRWASLSPATQQALEPFLTPPIYPSSRVGAATAPARERGAAIRADWTRIETARAAVWYRAADAGAAAAASNVAAEIEYVWSQEKALFGHEPKTDSGRTSNGGDGKLDLYLLPSFRDPKNTGAGGVTSPYPGQDSSQPRAVYILIRIESASTVPEARATVAHEFFHAIAATYNNGFNGWLNEATATWMEDHVYPTGILNMEHVAAGGYLTSGYKRSYDQPADPYHDYLFLFYLARRFSPGVNAQIWNNVDGGMAPLQAVDAGTPGGFAAQWADFALYCWNRPDVNNFEKWDNLSGGLVAALAEPYLPLYSGNGAGTSLQPRTAPHLSMSYAYVEVLSDKIKRLQIDVQPVAGGGGSAKTKAWIKFADGTTKTEDWSGKDHVIFCLDKTGQQVSQLLILYSNSATGAPAVWNEGKVVAAESGCGYHGTVKATHKEEDNNETIDVTATFVHVPPDYGGVAVYNAQDFTVRYKGSHKTNDGCEASMVVTRTFTGTATTLMMFDTNVSPSTYQSQSAFIAQGTETIVCKDGGTTTKTGAAAGLWLSVPAGRYAIKPDGSLSGTYKEGPWTWTWDLRLDPE